MELYYHHPCNLYINILNALEVTNVPVVRNIWHRFNVKSVLVDIIYRNG